MSNHNYPTEQSMRLEDVFVHPAHLIRRAHQIFVSVFDREFRQTDVTPVQYMILASLAEHRALDMSAVAGTAAIDKASCNRFVQQLIEQGLVSLTNAANDKRRKVVTLTPQGTALLPELHKCAVQVRDSLLQGLTDAEETVFLTALSNFVTINNDLSRAPHAPAEQGDDDFNDR